MVSYKKDEHGTVLYIAIFRSLATSEVHVQYSPRGT